ncbi:MAG: DUF1592 domain-containing protein [Planctomycetes bacterium]|nr:DUF1592 domain-containing protein [Planctomycetota bacterium]
MTTAPTHLVAPLAAALLALVCPVGAQAPGDAPPAASAATEATNRDPTDFATKVQPLLQRYCYRCHGPDKQKGDVRLDTLDPGLAGRADAEGWRAALDMINGAEMPPEDEDQPDDAERRVIVDWMTGSLRAAAARFAGDRHTVLRRLTKDQYTNALQDLLGVPIDFGRALPDDGKSKMGFSNNGAVLQASPLHLDYYQQIARQALDQAIVSGPRPQPTRYRITFGRGIGVGKVAAETGGYQSVPLSRNDFVIDILGADGAPLVPEDAAQQAEFDRIRRKISVGLRGSSEDRFTVVDEGIVLYSALPHVEKAPGSWQGPSPNLKLEMQRVFPEHGALAMRVQARRGTIPTAHKQVLVSPEDRTTLAGFDEAGGVRAPDAAIVLLATDSKQRQNVRLEGDTLRSVDVPKPSKARLSFRLPRDGFFQVDLVHPVVPADAMASVRLNIDNRRLDLRPELTAAQRQQPRAITALGVANLRAGDHALELGGPFFVGFSHVVISPLAAEHPFVQRTTAKVSELNAAIAGKLPAIRAYAGTRTDDGMVYSTFGTSEEVNATDDGWQTFEFTGRLENMPIPEPESGDNEILSGFLLVGLYNDHLVKSRAETGPPLLVHSIEVEAPYHRVWPPKSHTDIFVEAPGRPGGEAPDEAAYTRLVLERFLSRAFRRPVRASEVERYLGFWREVRGQFDCYEDAVREVLVAALCSPNFLFLAEPVAAADAPAADALVDEPALATRLSFFLWNSPPDSTLGDLAAAGQLRAALPQQLERMLDDPRAARFVRSFTREWLRLDRLENVAVNVDRFPAFTRFVKRDMAEETYRFVAEVLRTNASVLQFVDADFTMLNQNLAEFYGIPGVAGPQFRRVPVTAAQRRGGLLSQGAFLAGHSDGTSPHPIKRAVWLKKQLLGDEPPPPPPNVPRLDPDAPGAANLTLAQQLERHRDSASCRDCHKGIDPYGLAFENYNAVGLFELQRGGKPVDASTTLPDGTAIDGIDALKRWLLDEQADVLARAFVEHLFAYALGRDVHFADDEELQRITAASRQDGYRVRAIVRHIVGSDSFQRP